VVPPHRDDHRVPVRLGRLRADGAPSPEPSPSGHASSPGGRTEIVFNLSVGTDNVADAVQELRWFLQLGTERILRAGVLDLTMEELEAMRHLQGQSDQGAAEILRTLSPGQRARPLVELRVPVLDSVLANPPAGFGHIEEQALRDVRWQVHLLADEARAAEEWLRLTCMTADHSDNHARVVANLDGTREAYRRRVIVAVRMIRVALSVLKAGQPRRTAVIARRARGRHAPNGPGRQADPRPSSASSSPDSHMRNTQ